MTLSATTVPELQCIKIVKTFVLTTDLLNVAIATSIEVQIESGMPPVTSTGRSETKTGGADSLLEPSRASDSTGSTNKIGTASVHSSATTLLTTNRSNLTPLSTQDPIETSTNATAGNSRTNIIPAAVGGALGAIAIFVLLFIYAFLRQRRQRRAQGVDSQTRGKSTRHSPGSQDKRHLIEKVQHVQNAWSEAPNCPAITEANKAFSSSAISQGGPPEESSAQPQKNVSEHRPRSFANVSKRQRSKLSAPTPLANPFPEGLTSSKSTAPHGASRDEDSDSEHSSPFNLDLDSGNFSAQAVLWGNTSNGSQYSCSIGPKNTNSSFPEQRMSLRRTNSSQWRVDHRMSTHSDPFDLEKL